MPKDSASVGEVLRQIGYNTLWVGKNHNVPDWQNSQIVSGHYQIIHPELVHHMPFYVLPTLFALSNRAHLICGTTEMALNTSTVSQ